jgi:hypothetical protein
MDEERIPPDRERQLLELFEQAALHDFPNPERIGCPGSEFVRRLVTDRGSIPFRDPRVTHVTRCSPCFQEFAAIRAEIAAKAKRQRRARQMQLAAGIVVIGLGVAGYLGREHPRTPLGGDVVAAHLDFRDSSTVRGTAGSPSPVPKADLSDLPHKNLDLTIALPFSSEAGQYQVQVLRELSKPLISAYGTAKVQPDGTTLLSVRLDLSKIPPGPYQIGFRRIPWDWTIKHVQVQ